jgi:methylglyoxal synthase
MTNHTSRRIALVAHDHKKPDLLEWAEFNRGTLAAHELVATGTTGGLLRDRLGLDVRRLHSGPLGGDMQLGALITEEAIDLLVFFWDPLEPQPHDPDVRALLRIAVVWNTPTACNRATADYLISSPLLRRPDYIAYSAEARGPRPAVVPEHTRFNDASAVVHP